MSDTRPKFRVSLRGRLEGCLNELHHYGGKTEHRQPDHRVSHAHAEAPPAEARHLASALGDLLRLPLDDALEDRPALLAGSIVAIQSAGFRFVVTPQKLLAILTP